ncbi:MAG: hypothetical protein GY806_18205 [Gammaproteobacteria bacterium]|nr:hypothetical protein [Gammaproteobacteria bacterium]
MIDRSYEIIKHLNRLANDRNLSPGARNKVRDAAQHIKFLQNEIQADKAIEEKES